MNHVQTAFKTPASARNEALPTYFIEALEVEEITLSDVSSTMRDSDGSSLFDSGMFSLSIDNAYQP